MSSILIINPNSTAAMTEALKPIVAPLLPSGVTATYFTGPPDSPPSINDSETSLASAKACLPHLLPHLDSHSSFLVACYSSHPLVPMLRQHTARPVVGIFEASVFHSLALLQPEEGFAIVTTGKKWEELLADGVEELTGCRKRLEGVMSTGLDADQLHRVGREELEKRMREATRRALQGGKVKVVCLGCAGMVGLGELVRGVAEEMGLKGVRVVDGVEAGVGFALSMEGRGYEKV